jgi:hypothetical protein
MRDWTGNGNQVNTHDGADAEASRKLTLALLETLFGSVDGEERMFRPGPIFVDAFGVETGNG